MFDKATANRDLLCANSCCSFLVHTNPAFGGYCCRICHWAFVHRIACTVRGHHCQGYEVLDPESSLVERAPLDFTPQRPLRRGWTPPFVLRPAAQDVTGTHSQLTAEVVHLSTKNYGVADVSGSVVKVDLGGASALGSVSVVVSQDVAVDAVSRRGIISATPAVPVPKLKSMELLFTNSVKGKRRRMKDEELEKEVQGDAARDNDFALQKEVATGPHKSDSGGHIWHGQCTGAGMEQC